MQKNKVEKINIALINKDVINLASIINKNILNQKKHNLDIIKREKKLKEAILSISHDLRTPLTSIIGYLQLLKRSKLNSEQNEFVEIVLNRSDGLKKLICDFYELSILEISENKPNFQRVNISKVITECVLNYFEEFDKRNIVPKLKISKEVDYAYVDKLMLERIINNLLINALRYSNGDLSITVTASEWINISFKNGIFQNKMFDPTKLFEKFYTGDEARNKHGTGLGLYITKLLIEKMGGQVFAKLQDNMLDITILLMRKS
ncbi:HAMP domain-containing sensor histidine kinase [Clostridium sp. HBUAS56017]|uniref:sensor histidine kinase n=1 Tax=Clostridium sp. HBUAS56017 TaxID=2571128 RepID=UPI001A9C11F8|nr:HAMP domain-containing sensor histidine kinase [Clostridium sp. HBUAS56017]